MLPACRAKLAEVACSYHVARSSWSTSWKHHGTRISRNDVFGKMCRFTTATDSMIPLLPSSFLPHRNPRNRNLPPALGLRIPPYSNMAANAKPAELKDMLQEREISYIVSQICVEHSDQNTSKLKYFWSIYGFTGNCTSTVCLSNEIHETRHKNNWRSPLSSCILYKHLNKHKWNKTALNSGILWTKQVARYASQRSYPDHSKTVRGSSVLSKVALKSNQNLPKPNSHFISVRKGAQRSLGPRNAVDGGKPKIKSPWLHFV